MRYMVCLICYALNTKQRNIQYNNPGKLKANMNEELAVQLRTMDK